LADQTNGFAASGLANELLGLDPTAQDKDQALEVLLGLLAHETDKSAVARLLGGVVQLASTAEDKRQAREALLGLLARETDRSAAATLVGGMTLLDPTARDLSTWQTWADLPTAELLAAVRRNSAPADWLATLPSLASLSGSLR
jgi:hypothetical protein